MYMWLSLINNLHSVLVSLLQAGKVRQICHKISIFWFCVNFGYFLLHLVGKPLKYWTCFYSKCNHSYSVSVKSSKYKYTNDPHKENESQSCKKMIFHHFMKIFWNFSLVYFFNMSSVHRFLCWFWKYSWWSLRNHK